jgi:hypothetical protein
MKRLFFLLPVLFFIKVSAQDPYEDYKKFKEKILLDSLKAWEKFYMTIDSSHFWNQKMKNTAIFQTMGKLIFIQPNGTKVYSLPQDNMICFVPDLSQYNYNMPNPAKKKVTGMPPGSAPQYKIIPDNKR